MFNPISAAYQQGPQGISAAQPAQQGMAWGQSSPQTIIQQNPQMMQMWANSPTPQPGMNQAYRQSEQAAMQPIGQAPANAPEWLAQNPGKNVQNWQSALQNWQQQYQGNLSQQPGAQTAFQWAGGPGRKYFKPQGMFGDLAQIPVIGPAIKGAAEVIGRPGDIASNPAQWFGSAMSAAAPFLGPEIGPWAKLIGMGGNILQHGVQNPLSMLGSVAMSAAPFVGGDLGQALRYGGQAFNMGNQLAHGGNPLMMASQAAMPFLPQNVQQGLGYGMNAYNAYNTLSGMNGRAWGR